MKRLLFLTLLVTIKLALSTVDVNVTQYVGHWYQMYKDIIDPQESNAYCAQAYYSIRSDKNISVLNIERVNSVNGPIQNISGYATYPNPTTSPGQLVVYLDGVPVPGDYWILSLGPIVNNQYEYSIVSDRFSITLFVLARDPIKFLKYYDTKVQEELKLLNFTNFYNKPIQMIQEGCLPLPPIYNQYVF